MVAQNNPVNTTQFKGTGGPPPQANGGGSRFKKLEYALYEPVNAAQKKVSPFFLPSNGSALVTVLDNVTMFDTSVRLHARFKANGVTTNHAVCISQLDERKCPLCDVLGEQGRGKWFACGTVLDGSEWTIPSGKRQGEVITNQRRLLLVNARQLDIFKLLGKKGFRGRQYNVARGSDQKAARIGEAWVFEEAFTDEQMVAKFSSAAKAYGLPVEEYLKPFPYEKVLTPMSYEKLVQIANSIKANAGEAPAVTSSAPVTEDSAEIPFDV